MPGCNVLKCPSEAEVVMNIAPADHGRPRERVLCKFHAAMFEAGEPWMEVDRALLMGEDLPETVTGGHWSVTSSAGPVPRPVATFTLERGGEERELSVFISAELVRGLADRLEEIEGRGKAKPPEG